MRSVDAPGRDLDLELAIDHDPPNDRRKLLVLAVALLAAGLYSLTASSSIPEILASSLGPILILAFVWRRGLSDPLAVVCIALIGDIVGVVYGATVRTGLAFAVLLPSVGISAMSGVLKGRAWLALAASAWVATAAGGLAWMTVGPASREMPLVVPGTSMAGIMAVGGFGLALLWRSNRIQERAVAAAHEAAAQTAAGAAELARTTELLRTVLDATPVPIQAFAPDRTGLAWNRAAERLFGWGPEEVIGRTLPEAMTPDEETKPAEDRMRRILAGATVAGERARRLTKDGRTVLVDFHATAMHDATGKPVGIVGVLVDATERQALEDQRVVAQARERELEDQLRQAQKMEAIGQLAGGVAHDFNNMLTAIRGFAELALMGLSDADVSAREDLRHIIDTSDSAARLTQQLLTFARRTVLEPRVVDPAEVLQATASMIGRLVGEQIELAIEPTLNPGLIRVDPVRLEQAILNLAVNARDAMPDGGRLTIRVERCQVDRDFAAQHPGAVVGPHVVIRVSDTGQGMDEATLEHIFEPFFTTKEVGKGTGMGLATVFGIVSMSGGVIDVVSETGAGSSIALYFPEVLEAAAEEGSVSALAVPAGGSETILLVEDDASVRRFARRSLESFGYQVVEAGDGVEALAVADGLARLDLLVSDITMPRMQGTELARRLSEERSDFGVLLISGHTEAAARSDLGPNHVFLETPYSQAGLAAAVRSALARRG